MKTKPFFLFSFFLLLIISVIVPIATVSAQQSTPSDDEVNAIARQLYCPVCENTPLDVCPTTACHQWRELIRQMLAEGKSEAEIKQYFVDYYGAHVLSEPPRTGINWLVYIVPPVAFLAGIYLLFRAFQTWKRIPMGQVAGQSDSSLASSRSEPEISSGSSKDDEYVIRFEEELRKRK
jgi:cytochrome c-type biogenesis protein CcmH